MCYLPKSAETLPQEVGLKRITLFSGELHAIGQTFMLMKTVFWTCDRVSLLYVSSEILTNVSFQRRIIAKEAPGWMPSISHFPTDTAVSLSQAA